MHKRAGKWISVDVRFRRWVGQGAWDAPPQKLIELGLTDDWLHLIDTTVRIHNLAAGGKGGAPVKAFGRTGGDPSKGHAGAKTIE